MEVRHGPPCSFSAELSCDSRQIVPRAEATALLNDDMVSEKIWLAERQPTIYPWIGQANHKSSGCSLRPWRNRFTHDTFVYSRNFLQTRPLVGYWLAASRWRTLSFILLMYSPWGQKESDTTERLTASLSQLIYNAVLVSADIRVIRL